MPRPKHDQPTPGELEVLHFLWQHGPATVREVMEGLQRARPRAYTSVMSLLNVMAEKGLLTRTPEGRAFRYAAKAPRERTLGQLLQDLVGRAFEGSASALVAHLLNHAKPSKQELDQIRKLLDEQSTTREKRP